MLEGETSSTKDGESRRKKKKRGYVGKITREEIFEIKSTRESPYYSWNNSLLRGKGGLLQGCKDVKRWAVEPIYVDIFIFLLYSHGENPEWWGWP